MASFHQSPFHADADLQTDSLRLNAVAVVALGSQHQIRKQTFSDEMTVSFCSLVAPVVYYLEPALQAPRAPQAQMIVPIYEDAGK